MVWKNCNPDKTMIFSAEFSSYKFSENFKLKTLDIIKKLDIILISTRNIRVLKLKNLVINYEKKAIQGRIQKNS